MFVLAVKMTMQYLSLKYNFFDLMEFIVQK